MTGCEPVDFDSVDPIVDQLGRVAFDLSAPDLEPAQLLSLAIRRRNPYPHLAYRQAPLFGRNAGEVFESRDASAGYPLEVRYRHRHVALDRRPDLPDLSAGHGRREPRALTAEVGTAAGEQQRRCRDRPRSHQ